MLVVKKGYIDEYVSIVQSIKSMTRNELRHWTKTDKKVLPKNIQVILSDSRLDLIIEMTEALDIWFDKLIFSEADSILAYANLGALVESWLKFFYVIYIYDAKNSMSYTFFDSPKHYRKFNKLVVQLENEKSLNNILELEHKILNLISAYTVNPDKLSFENLKVFNFKMFEDKNLFDWISKIQQKRNNIHFFTADNISTYDEFINDLFVYSRFLGDLSEYLPPIEDYL